MTKDARRLLDAVIIKHGTCSTLKAKGTATTITSSDDSNSLVVRIEFMVEFNRKGPIEIGIVVCPGTVTGEEKRILINGIHGDYEIFASHSARHEKGYSLYELITRTEMVSLGLTKLLFELLMPNESMQSSFLSEDCFSGSRVTENTRNGTVLLEGMNELDEHNSMRIHKSDHGLLSYSRRFVNSPLDHKSVVETQGPEFGKVTQEKVLALESFETTYEFNFTRFT